ncbi:MAG: XRE family transcriptional regulator [Desulfarculales bacterium]|jgi:transcriptional regulator with XRE-family HTH domain|nr:XRE family transcriptional regulator [Desulfarculales bacterium]
MSEMLGKRIRKFRENKKLSLEELAQRAALDPEFLATLEEDEIYPSLQPLVKIARALNVRLGTFLDDQVSQDPLLVRKEERQPQFTTHRGKDKASEVTFYSLGRGKTDRHMEPFYVELLPESAAQPLSSHEGEEFIVVISGQVELIYGKKTFVLDPGDSIYYNSVVSHHLGCKGGNRAEIYAVLYFPS